MLLDPYHILIPVVGISTGNIAVTNSDPKVKRACNCNINIYYCMNGRAIWGNIQLEGGSIGPTEGRDITEPEN